MTPDQIARIRTSFARVTPITDDVARRFYGRLFNLAPDTEALFKGDMREQGRKLFQTLAGVVEALDRIDDILPDARELAIRHVRYGVQDRHYALVGAALLDTLRGVLGADFDHATEDAWDDAYTLLSGAMIAAAVEFRDR